MMPQTRVKEAVNRPVRDYEGLAVYVFKRTAGATYQALARLRLLPDWRQEISLAAWTAQRDRLGSQSALRFYARSAYRALRNMGFARPAGSQGFVQRA
jgi:hypothetical protein